MKEPKGNRNCRCNLNLSPKSIFRAPRRPIEVDPQKSLYTPIWGLKEPETDCEIQQALREKACAIEDLQTYGFETQVIIIDDEKLTMHLMVRKPKINPR